MLGLVASIKAKWVFGTTFSGDVHCVQALRERLTERTVEAVAAPRRGARDGRDLSALAHLTPNSRESAKAKVTPNTKKTG